MFSVNCIGISFQLRHYPWYRHLSQYHEPHHSPLYMWLVCGLVLKIFLSWRMMAFIGFTLMILLMVPLRMFRLYVQATIEYVWWSWGVCVTWRWVIFYLSWMCQLCQFIDGIWRLLVCSWLDILSCLVGTGTLSWCKRTSSKCVNGHNNCQ